MKKRKEHIDLLIIGMLAFLCSLIFVEFKIKGSTIAIEERQAEWIRSVKDKIISCSPFPSVSERQANNKKHEDKDSGNGCPHEAGFFCFLSNNGNKRSKIHSC